MELGSEFDISFENLRIVDDTIYTMLKNYNTIYFNTGRNAIKALVNSLNFDYVLLPEYICESVISCFDNRKIIFYHLEDNLLPDIDDLLPKLSNNTLLYFVHYFGIESKEYNDCVEALRIAKEDKKCVVLEDTTHNFFNQCQYIGDYCVASLRKWVAIPDGAVLYTKNRLCKNNFHFSNEERNKKIYGMVLKNIFLNGIMDCNKEYRQIFAEAEHLYDEQTKIYFMSTISEFLLNCYSINQIVTKRRNNYNYLFNLIKDYDIDLLGACKENECPIALPLYIEDRDNFREYLIQRKVYCAVHWPILNTPLEDNIYARRMSQHLISLPIDQRYGVRNMDYLFEQIKGFYNDRY